MVQKRAAVRSRGLLPTSGWRPSRSAHGSAPSAASTRCTGAPLSPARSMRVGSARRGLVQDPGSDYQMWTKTMAHGTATPSRCSIHLTLHQENALHASQISICNGWRGLSSTVEPDPHPVPVDVRIRCAEDAGLAEPQRRVQQDRLQAENRPCCGRDVALDHDAQRQWCLYRPARFARDLDLRMQRCLPLTAETTPLSGSQDNTRGCAGTQGADGAYVLEASPCACSQSTSIRHYRADGATK